MFPDGFWRKCCLAHDKVYWKGGTYIKRLKEDWQLQRCVRAMAKVRGIRKSDDWKEKLMVRSGPVGPFLMFLGPQIFGIGLAPTTFRWGFGHQWPYSKE